MNETFAFADVRGTVKFLEPGSSLSDYLRLSWRCWSGKSCSRAQSGKTYDYIARNTTLGLRAGGRAVFANNPRLAGYPVGSGSGIVWQKSGSKSAGRMVRGPASVGVHVVCCSATPTVDWDRCQTSRDQCKVRPNRFKESCLPEEFSTLADCPPTRIHSHIYSISKLGMRLKSCSCFARTHPQTHERKGLPAQH
ncbi:hypothetical protein J6590_055216 [Homalodisca vitripennis]|nr:hypothetical protein J6590_055216 [Homalodisca vitripennis]